MSKSTTFIQGLRKFICESFREDVPKINVSISQWGFMEMEDWYYPNVCLQEWVLYLNFSTGMKLSVNGRMVELDPHKVYLFPPYTGFGGIHKDKFMQFYIHFKADAPFNSVKTEMLTFSADIIRDKVLKCIKSSDSVKQALYLTQIALCAIEQVPKKMLIPAQKTILDSRIRTVLEIINENPAAPHSIEDLCSAVKMSVNNFHRKFQSCTFTTPKQYILKKRMEFARDLLINSELSVDEIAEKTGFVNRYHFSKVFKNYYSMPPITYRKFIISKNKKKVYKYDEN